MPKIRSAPGLPAHYHAQVACRLTHTPYLRLSPRPSLLTHSLKDVIAAPTSSSVYLILELLDLDLYTALRQFPSAFTTQRVKVTALQLLAGLKHAHARGVMHRDLKPQNVLLAKANGLVKIADFGMARGFLPEDTKSSYTDWVSRAHGGWGVQPWWLVVGWRLEMYVQQQRKKRSK